MRILFIVIWKTAQFTVIIASLERIASDTLSYARTHLAPSHGRWKNAATPRKNAHGYRKEDDCG